jgi:hypothetical protein
MTSPRMARRNTDDCIAYGGFGSPTFVVNGGENEVGGSGRFSSADPPGPLLDRLIATHVVVLSVVPTPPAERNARPQVDGTHLYFGNDRMLLLVRPPDITVPRITMAIIIWPILLKRPLDVMVWCLGYGHIWPICLSCWSVRLTAYLRLRTVGACGWLLVLVHAATCCCGAAALLAAGECRLLR